MSKAKQLIPDDYAALLAQVKARVRAAQYGALKAVNKELVALYWDIGRMTTERQAVGTYGTTVVKRLAADLQAEFPGIIGFSWRNLFNMSEFFTTYRDMPKLQPLAAIIGWTQNLVILQRCKEYDAMAGPPVCAAACCTNVLLAAAKPRRQAGKAGEDRGWMKREITIGKERRRSLRPRYSPFYDAVARLFNCATGDCTISLLLPDEFKGSLPTVEEIEAELMRKGRP
ncbi:MAG: DUF1016 N-terminal domain-containing protein [bacterium]